MVRRRGGWPLPTRAEPLGVRRLGPLVADEWASAKSLARRKPWRLPFALYYRTGRSLILKNTHHSF
jgi:hypothetical protein